MTAEFNCPECQTRRTDPKIVCPTFGAPPLREGDDKRGAEEEVRSQDLEPYVTLRYIARLFKVLAVLMVIMLIGEIITGLTADASEALPVLIGEITQMLVLAGLMWGGGDLTLRAMLSADPVTADECGYPDLLATGEFCDGEPLHDRQHPHDLFMELVGVYEAALTQDVALQLYGGPVGEPALGPVAFPHRISSLPNPIAPIGHHWLDSTHIAFGVATAGIYGRRWKAEASLFNGREPDAERYDLDLDALDSYSGRLWFLPSDRWALQVSAGRLNEAEVHEVGGPRIDVSRVTVSATYHRPLTEAGIWASTIAGFATAPPNDPEWRSVLVPRRSIW